MVKPSEPLDEAIDAARESLRHIPRGSASQALPHLRDAQEHLARAIDEAMAAALVDEGGSIRGVASLAGFTENAVGPRVARTASLAPYANPPGRVTASGVERARYDREYGRPAPAPPAPVQPTEPLRFRRRRND